MTCPTTNLEVKLTGKIPWMCAIVLLVLKRGSKVLGCVGNSNGEVSGVEIWEFTTWTSKFFGVGKKPVFFPHWFQQGDHKSHGVEVQGWILSIFTSDCQKGKDGHITFANHKNCWQTKWRGCLLVAREVEFKTTIRMDPYSCAVWMRDVKDQFSLKMLK